MVKDDATPQGRGLSSRRAARHTSAVPSAPSIGCTDEPFALRITRWYADEPFRWLTPFLQGMAAGLLLVIIGLLVSQQLN